MTTDGRTLMQEVKSGSSLGSGNDTTLHFGLGKSTVNELSVVWPNGNRIYYRGVTRQSGVDAGVSGVSVEEIYSGGRSVLRNAYCVRSCQRTGFGIGASTSPRRSSLDSRCYSETLRSTHYAVCSFFHSFQRHT